MVECSGGEIINGGVVNGAILEDVMSWSNLRCDEFVINMKR